MSTTYLAALTAVAAMIVGMVLYLLPIVRQSKEKAPVLATWILFAVASSLSLWTYLHSKNHSVAANVGNAVDPLASWSAVFILAYYSWRRWRRVVFEFNRVQIGCLIAVGLILIYWFWTSNEMYANLAVQVIIVVGYVLTIRKLRPAPRNTEPIGAWVAIWLGSLISLIPAWASPNILPKVYAIRAIICIFVLFVFMIRAELRGRKPTY